MILRLRKWSQCTEGLDINLTTRLDAHLTLEIHQDDVTSSFDWSHSELRKSYETTLLAWAPKGQYEVQWVTLRYLREFRKAVLIVRADATARKEFLCASGTTIVYVKESAPKGVKLEYALVWLQNPHRHSNPVGVVQAAAKMGPNWGIARGARNFGIRAPIDSLAQYRARLRPDDGAINEANKSLVPSTAWVIKGICAQATASEISSAICPVWAILPVKQLAVKKGKATWLVDAAAAPPNNIFKAGGQILFAEPHRKDAKPKRPPRDRQETSSENPEKSWYSGMGAQTRTGSAKRPFRSMAAGSGLSDPLQKKDPWNDPWSGWSKSGSKQDASAASSSSRVDPGVLGRLNQAEQAISRLEGRQEKVEQEIHSMRGFMDDRFNQVMNGLAALQPELKRKDSRGGKVTRWISANTTSLRKHWKELIDMEAPILSLTETLYREEDAYWMTPALRSKGYRLYPGVDSPVVGSLNMRKAGVAFLVHDSIAVTTLAPTMAMREPYKQARLQYVALSHVTGKIKTRAVVFYGRAGKPEENVAEVASILDDLSKDRDTPTVFSGDLNISDDHVFWDEVRAQAIWSDPHCVLGSDAPQFTCWPTQGQPSRIDFFVLSTHAMSSVTEVEVHTGTTLPVHAPIEIRMDLDIRSVDILSYPQPLPLSAPAGLPGDLVAFQDEFQRLLFDNRLAEAYERWSRYWESWMLSDAPPTVNKASHMGRGTTAKIVNVPPKPPRSTEAPPDVCFLRKFLGRLREFSRLRHYDSGYALSLGDKVRRQAEMYMKRFGTPPPHPSGNELRALELHVAATLQARQSFHDKTSKEKCRARLTHRLGVHKTVSQAVRRTADASIRSMRETKKSQPLLEREQIFSLLDGYWQQIRMAPGRDLEEWEREFLDEIPQSPQGELPKLEPKMIRERLAAMKPHTSKGPDAWSVLELRALPDEAICQLTMFLAAVETWGSWPEAMREIHVVPLQKESDPYPG